MTRFARAKGSKASNEKVPEEATSWSEMKQQLLKTKQQAEEMKKKQEVDKQRMKNYNAFLQQVDDEKVKTTKWAEFPINAKKLTRTKVKITTKNGRISKKLKRKCDLMQKNMKRQNESHDVLVQSVAVNKTKKKKQIKDTGIQTDADPESKKKVPGIKLSIKGNACKESKVVSKDGIKKIKIKCKGVKRKMDKDSGNVLKKKKLKDSLSEEDLKKIEKKKEKRLRQLEKKKLKKQNKESMQKKNTKRSLTPHNDENKLKKLNNSSKSLTENKMKKYEKKKMKLGHSASHGNQKHERRKKFQETMIFNGKKIEIAYVDGFPIKKEDADRILELRKQMISKGLPRSEIKVTLKLERRRAEKAFAREKKKVCFNCRKSGHNLSECPDLGKQLAESTGTGICFKCGSTEHTHFECKVVRGQEFKYAQCFICQEQGHIARQCPDNARGLYPKGGACRVCGDVTHLKKDCPKYQAQQEQLQQNVQIETMNNTDNPDCLDQVDEFAAVKEIKRPQKIIKF